MRAASSLTSPDHNPSHVHSIILLNVQELARLLQEGGGTSLGHPYQLNQSTVSDGV